MTKKQESINKLLAPVIAAMGYEYIGCDYLGSGRFTTLRVYIDKEGGVNLEDCRRVSSQLSAVLDVEDPIAGKYTLEVSSPGINRPLFTLEQFRKCVGKKASVRLSVSLNERRNFKGTIVGIEDVCVILDVDGEKFKLQIDLISKANLE